MYILGSLKDSLMNFMVTIPINEMDPKNSAYKALAKGIDLKNAGNNPVARFYMEFNNYLNTQTTAEHANDRLWLGINNAVYSAANVAQKFYENVFTFLNPDNGSNVGRLVDAMINIGTLAFAMSFIFLIFYCLMHPSGAVSKFGKSLYAFMIAMFCFGAMPQVAKQAYKGINAWAQFTMTASDDNKYGSDRETFADYNVRNNVVSVPHAVYSVVANSKVKGDYGTLNNVNLNTNVKGVREGETYGGTNVKQLVITPAEMNSTERARWSGIPKGAVNSFLQTAGSNDSLLTEDVLNKQSSKADKASHTGDQSKDKEDDSSDGNIFSYAWDALTGNTDSGDKDKASAGTNYANIWKNHLATSGDKDNNISVVVFPQFAKDYQNNNVTSGNEQQSYNYYWISQIGMLSANGFLVILYFSFALKILGEAMKIFFLEKTAGFWAWRNGLKEDKIKSYFTTMLGKFEAIALDSTLIALAISFLSVIQGNLGQILIKIGLTNPTVSAIITAVVCFKLLRTALSGLDTFNDQLLGRAKAGNADPFLATLMGNIGGKALSSVGGLVTRSLGAGVKGSLQMGANSLARRRGSNYTSPLSGGVDTSEQKFDPTGTNNAKSEGLNATKGKNATTNPKLGAKTATKAGSGTRSFGRGIAGNIAGNTAKGAIPGILAGSQMIPGVREKEADGLASVLNKGKGTDLNNLPKTDAKENADNKGLENLDPTKRGASENSDKTPNLIGGLTGLGGLYVAGNGINALANSGIGRGNSMPFNRETMDQGFAQKNNKPLNPTGKNGTKPTTTGINKKGGGLRTRSANPISSMGASSFANGLGSNTSFNPLSSGSNQLGDITSAMGNDSPLSSSFGVNSGVEGLTGSPILASGEEGSIDGLNNNGGSPLDPSNIGNNLDYADAIGQGLSHYGGADSFIGKAGSTITKATEFAGHGFSALNATEAGKDGLDKMKSGGTAGDVVNSVVSGNDSSDPSFTKDPIGSIQAGVGHMVNGAVNGGTVGAEIGSALPVGGTIVGGIGGGIAGGAVGSPLGRSITKGVVDPIGDHKNHEVLNNTAKILGSGAKNGVDAVGMLTRPLGASAKGLFNDVTGQAGSKGGVLDNFTQAVGDSTKDFKASIGDTINNGMDVGADIKGKNEALNNGKKESVNNFFGSKSKPWKF